MKRSYVHCVICGTFFEHFNKRIKRHWFGEKKTLSGVKTHLYNGFQVFGRFYSLRTNRDIQAASQIGHGLTDPSLKPIR